MTITRFLPILLGLSLHVGAHAADFSVTSADIAPGQTLAPAQVFQGFGCTGGNQSPQLSWHGAPAGTQSYAITMYDPDAPTGSGWWHWSVFNLPSSTTSLAAASANLPAGAVQGRNDYGDSAFGGACPPPGERPHRYQITVWALKTDKLPLDRHASGAMLGYMLNANALGKAQLTGLYGR